MKVDLQKVLINSYTPDEEEEFEFFKQFNIFETIDYRSYLSCQYDSYGNMRFDSKKYKICKLENTHPSIKIISMKIVDTIEGTSLEGQHLTGKKLILSGTIDFSLIVTFGSFQNKQNSKILPINMPFSTFIVVPKDICNEETIKLKYLIEDISLMQLSTYKILVSATAFVVYLDEY